ncbi:MAG: DUF3313 domain-containing protein [Desulfobacteraceae bacterium]|nr:MAG: DUF3313 domain-containing protein [Desulfobacteraceae bacterium]
MKKPTLTIFWLFFVPIFLLAAGCASKKPHYSGFLEDYPEFQPGQKGGVDLVYLKEGVDFKKYNKMMLDHIIFFTNPDAKFKGVEADELKKLEDSFHSALKNELEKEYPLVAYPIVDAPAPDVMKLRIAVTTLNPGRPVVCGAAMALLPIRLTVGEAKKAITGEDIGAGSASIEVEMLDSMTNQRIAAAIDNYSESPDSCVSAEGAAHEAFGFWAKRLRFFMDTIHGN